MLQNNCLSNFTLDAIFFVAVFYDLPPPPGKTSMTMENQPFEDVFPIQNDDVPLSC